MSRPLGLVLSQVEAQQLIDYGVRSLGWDVTYGGPARRGRPEPWCRVKCGGGPWCAWTLFPHVDRSRSDVHIPRAYEGAYYRMLEGRGMW